MSEDNYDLGETNELSKRQTELSEFLERMFDEEDRPYFISDDACLYDIFAGVDDELSKRCLENYGRNLSQNDFRAPIWKLLDSLYRTSD
jgi:hypothetical protein